MIPAFKTGPNNFKEGQRIVTELGASVCEVWFNVNKYAEYKEMFAWLQKHDVTFGLHHWGVVDGNIKTNLATQDDHIRQETIRQIKQTIDIVVDEDAGSVNIHPGAECIETIDFTTGKQAIKENMRTKKELAHKIFLESAHELHEYAEDRNVLLTIESITAREKAIDSMREPIYDPGSIPLSVIEQFVMEGGWFANDISHTASHFLLSEENTEAAWKPVVEFSKRIADRTKLVHMNVITPPYNGTDSHDGITEEDFKQETFPEIVELIKKL